MDNHEEPEVAATIHSRLVVEKKPAPLSPERSLETSDAGHADERVVVERAGDSGRPTTAFRVVDSRVPYKAAADLRDDGFVTIRVEGSPQHGEENAERAAGSVMERLNAEGGRWERLDVVPKDSRKERSVDAVAIGADGEALPMQVTLAEQAIWEELHRYGVAQKTMSVDDAVEAMWQAIQAKEFTADPEVILVLDAANVAPFAFDVVVDRPISCCDQHIRLQLKRKAPAEPGVQIDQEPFCNR